MSEHAAELVACPDCGAHVKRQGLGVHRRMAHQMTAEQRIENARKAGQTRTQKAPAKKGSKKAGKVGKEPRPITPDAALPVEGVVDVPLPVAPDNAEALVMLDAIRKVLGPDLRVAELELQVGQLTTALDAATAKVGELEGKLETMRSVLNV